MLIDGKGILQNFHAQPVPPVGQLVQIAKTFEGGEDVMDIGFVQIHMCRKLRDTPDGFLHGKARQNIHRLYQRFHFRLLMIHAVSPVRHYLPTVYTTVCYYYNLFFVKNKQILYLFNKDKTEYYAI